MSHVTRYKYDQRIVEIRKIERVYRSGMTSKRRRAFLYTYINEHYQPRCCLLFFIRKRRGK